jgi:hypothetical protein
VEVGGFIIVTTHLKYINFNKKINYLNKVRRTALARLNINNPGCKPGEWYQG